MSMKKTAIFVAALAAGIGSLAAQGGGYLGALPYFSGFWTERMHGLSGQSAGLGTTRSAAMGGAFTSLGADLSSMSINPAGLGMYRNSEFGITLGPSVGELTNSMSKQASMKESRTGLALNNFGAAFNLFESAGSVTSFTLGVGYNRLADYNYRSRMNIGGVGASIIDVWDRQMEAYVNPAFGGIGADKWSAVEDKYGSAGNAARLYEYGAQMSYDVGLLNKPENIALDGFFSQFDVLSGNASVNKRYDMVSKGSSGEYAFSGGWNVGNKFYFGVTLGIVDLYQSREATYGETYENNNAPGMAEDPDYDLGPAEGAGPVREIRYVQHMRTTGEGYNAKFGIIYRPDPSIRVGLAYHTPTVITLRNKFSTSLDALYANGNSPYIDVLEREYQEKFYTPSRLLMGLSYTIAGRAILAADYECTWYNGMNVWGSDLYSQEQKDILRAAVKQYYTAGNTLRLGAEVQASDMLFLRAGYSWSDHGVRKSARDGSQMVPFNSPVCYRSNILSAGFGVKIGAQTSFDMTYSYGEHEYTGYNLFFFGADDATMRPGDSDTNFINPKLNRHNIMLGLNFRF